MTTLNETRHAGGFILSEANGTRSREVITVVSGQNLRAGAVLGRITASGKFKAYDNAASDGSQAAAAILFDDVNASAADAAGLAILRDAEVSGKELIFAVGQAAPDQAAAIVDLTALGVIVR
jgi:hypothetical protein